MAFVHQRANGQRLATRVDGALYYIHSDLPSASLRAGLGSTVAVSNDTGQPMGRVQYDPYGAVLASTLPLTLTDRLFTGQRLDSSTGLYYYNARYYDPHLGRFIQPDSLVPDPLNPQAWNRFSYCYNNPVSYVDPSGHSVLGLLAAFALGAVILTGVDYGVTSYQAGHFVEPVPYFLDRGWKVAIIGGVTAGLAYYLIPLSAQWAVGGADLLLGQGQVIGGTVHWMNLGARGATIIGTGASAFTAGVLNVGQNVAMRSWVTGEPTTFNDVTIDFMWGAGLFVIGQVLAYGGGQLLSETRGFGPIEHQIEGVKPLFVPYSMPRWGAIRVSRGDLSLGRQAFATTARAAGWAFRELVDFWQSSTELLIQPSD